MNKSMLILENVVKSIPDMDNLRKRELELIDHSAGFMSRILSFTGAAIIAYFLIGCAQSILLNKRILNKKLA